MLRVRPIRSTAHPTSWENLLTALGMVATEDQGECRVFDSGSGRLVLRSVPKEAPEAGSTAFAVEVGDPAEFARRTNLSAQDDTLTPAKLAGDGQDCRITSADGFSFVATKALHGAQCADADPALAVAGIWLTPDPASAARTLRHIGARPRHLRDEDAGEEGPADFTAKNGGLLLVRPTDGPARAGLGFEYDGGLEALQAKITAAGIPVRRMKGASGTTLLVPDPDAAGDTAAAEQVSLYISQRRPMG